MFITSAESTELFIGPPDALTQVVRVGYRGCSAPTVVRATTITHGYRSEMAWIYLGIAILSEVLGTSFLKESDGFSKLWPTVISLTGYALALLMLSLAVREINLGIAYAIWAGTGTALIVLIGWLVLGQKIDVAAIVGVSMIVGGVVVINAFSTVES